MGIKFDNRISLGTIVSALMLLGAIFGLYNKLDTRMTALETKVAPLWESTYGGKR